MRAKTNKKLIMSAVIAVTIIGMSYLPANPNNINIIKEPNKNNLVSTQVDSFTQVIVTRVVDGDTVVVKFKDNSEEKVRLIGVNTPESVKPNSPVEYYGKEASQYTKGKLFGKTVYLQKDISGRDRYQRLLRYIWLEKPQRIDENEIRQKMFNAILVIKGFAQQMTISPDVKYASCFKKFQREAREKSIGLWREQ